ncbi:MAG: hypothetical protein IK066_00680 [Kiritimatiellae bacterium]|nr:hypothetical protein [Kiritimatiellia bacterium]
MSEEPGKYWPDGRAEGRGKGRKGRGRAPEPPWGAPPAEELVGQAMEWWRKKIELERQARLCDLEAVRLLEDGLEGLGLLLKVRK